MRRIVVTGLSLMAVGLVSAATLLLMMWREHRLGVTLPEPTGTFAVGRTTFVLSTMADRSSDPPDSTSGHALMVWMWYPAVPGSGEAAAEYMPAPWREAVGHRQGLLMRSLFKREPAVVRPHGVADAAMVEDRGPHPVVLLRPGGSALTTDFTTLAEDLASHGFVVVGFDAPYRSFVFVHPDGTVTPRAPENNVENANGNLGDPVIGRLLASWVTDTQFVVSELERLNADRSWRFAGRLQMERVGMVGHSFGGATALQFCHQDARCKAVVDLDGIPFGSVVQEGLAIPGLLVASDHSHEPRDASSREILARIQSIYQRLPEARRGYVTIRNAHHFSFSDQSLLNSQVAMWLLRKVAGFGGLDSRRGLMITTDLVGTFFDVHMNGADPAAIGDLSTKYPELQSGNGGVH